MKVAIISMNGAKGGGVEGVVRTHYDILEKNGYEVYLISLPQIGLLAQLINNVSLFKKLALIVFPLISSLLAIRRVGKKGVVLSHGVSSIGYAVDVVFAHGCWSAYAAADGLHRSIYSVLTAFYERTAGRFSKRLVCVSKAVADAWVNYYEVNPRKISVLHNVVNYDIFRPDVNLDVSVKKKVEILFVGRLERSKGRDFILELADSLDEDWFLTICTPNTISSDDKRRLSFNQRVRCLSGLNTEEMAFEYNAATLMILPSKYEAFELCTLEALACGTPVLLNKTGTYPLLRSLACPALNGIESCLSPRENVQRVLKNPSPDRKEIATWIRSTLSFSAMERSLLHAVNAHIKD